ncbi:hypothetical protein [Spirosoma oryzicola]|uniref:hypothetical protein n=1 Tax=Spirosoma oryzicola TaxID=2898794 RepID=UPI001E5AE8DA|nr:hypothetical protein [Spirosoma oryzicola]UHG94677.1 hypothetical protein LQ777_29205 [Spirosoma oryzicola]
MKPINNLDESLRLLQLLKPELYWPKQVQEVDYETTLSDARRKELFDSLLKKHQLTFGQLLSQQLQSATQSVPALAEHLDLPDEVVNHMLSDQVHPATVPIVIMRDLLNQLSISYEMAKTAIWKTVNVLKSRQQDQIGNFGLAARKQLANDSPIMGQSQTNYVGDDEATSQYLDRLAEFMQP